MAFITIELRSNHGMGEPLVLEIPVPDTPDRILDKPWPQIDPPYPACKQILYCSCRLDLTYRLHNSLSHLRFDTLEEACFSGVENTVYDGLDDHQNFRSVRRRHRTEDFIAITMDNQVIRLRSRTNHMLEPPRVMEKWTIPAEAKYLYIGSANTADPAFRHRFLFDTDEQNLHRRLLRMAKHCEAFRFLKISTAYAHTAGYQFYAVYYQGDEISPEDQAVIDALNAFPKNDPVAFYDECMKHVPSEEYTVDRQGNRTGSYWNTTHALGKGIADFLNPETYCKMNRFETNAYEWERYSSDMEDDDDFGNIYNQQ